MEWFKYPCHCEHPPTPQYQSQQQQHMSLQLLIPSVLMGKQYHQSSERPQPKASSSSQSTRPTSTTSSLLAKALSRGREGNTAQPAPTPAGSASASANPTPSAIQPVSHDPSRPAGAARRVPAVTSKAMTTAPVRDKSRPHRRKYPTNMRQRH